MRPPAVLIAIVVAALAPAACGGDEDDPGERDERPPPRTITDPAEGIGAGAVEDADRLPRLPAGWQPHVDAAAGFAIGLPPGWSSGPIPGAQGSALTSPDGSAVVSVSADRTEGALQLPLAEFARRTAEALGSDVAGAGRFRDLRVGKPARFGHAYEAAAVRARGTPRGGGPERLLVAVVRREGLAAYVVVARAGAGGAELLAGGGTVERMIATLRGRPPR